MCTRLGRFHHAAGIGFRRHGLAAVSGLIVSAAAGTAHADPWDFGLVLDLSAIHSDNIGLAESGFERSENVYRIAPSFLLTKESDRLTADLRYQPEALFYRDSSEADDVYHAVDATMDFALVRDKLFVAFDAAQFQSSGSADQTFLTSNIPIAGNRLESTVWGISPRFQQRFAGADILASTSYRNVTYDQPDFLDSEQKSAQLTIDNYWKGEGVSWALDYQYVRMDFDSLSPPWEYQRASAELGYWVTGSVRLFGSGGVETPFDEFFEPDMSDKFWEGGFEYRPNERLEMEVAAGERGYGTSARGSLTYRMRRGETTISYTEGPETQNGIQGTRRPLQRTDNLDDFLSRPGVNNQFIRKRAELSSSIDLAKTTVTMRIFTEQRDDVFLVDGTPQNEESYEGAALRVDWQAGAKLGFALSGDVARRNGDSNSGDDLTRFGIDVNYDLSQRYGLVVRALRTEQEASSTGLAGYTENQYHLILRAEY